MNKCTFRIIRCDLLQSITGDADHTRALESTAVAFSVNPTCASKYATCTNGRTI